MRKRIKAFFQSRQSYADNAMVSRVDSSMNINSQSIPLRSDSPFQLQTTDEVITLTAQEKKNFDLVLLKMQNNPFLKNLLKEKLEEAAAFISVKRLLKKKYFTFKFSKAVAPPTFNTENSIITPKKELEVKFIIADIGNAPIRGIISPILELMKNGPLFGFFHAAFSIGDRIIEWNDSSLITPRAVGGANIVFATHVCKIPEEKIDQYIDILIDKIIEWNTNYQYDNMKKNCQDFVKDVFASLNIPLTFDGAVGYYINKMLRKGHCSAKLVLPDELADMLKKNKGSKIEFKTHKELDHFVNEIQTKYPYYFISKTGNPSGAEVKELLKAFDRAFWFRYIKEKKLVEQKALQALSPINVPDKDHCMFGDPLEHSMAV